MAKEMTEDQWRAFLGTGTRTGKLAVTRADGRPHVTPIWFDLDGSEIVFTTAEDSIKGRCLRRDPRACLCVDDQQPPYSFVMVEGAVQLHDDRPEVRRWAARFGERYMGPDRAEEFGERNSGPGEVLARMRITKVVAMQDMADIGR